MPALLQADPAMRYVLVNFAVLGAASVQATRVALAFAELHGPRRYLPFHLALFKTRGRIDGEAALEAVVRHGGDRGRLTALGDSVTVTDRMREALRVGSSLGLVATPSFVIGPEAYVGALSLEDKRAIIARARA